MEHDALVAMIVDIFKQNLLKPVKFEPSGIRIFDLTLDTFFKLYRSRHLIAQINIIYPLAENTVILELLYWSEDDIAQLESISQVITRRTGHEVETKKVTYEALSIF